MATSFPPKLSLILAAGRIQLCRAQHSQKEQPTSQSHLGTHLHNRCYKKTAYTRRIHAPVLFPLVHCMAPECARATEGSKRAACTVSDKLVICFDAYKTLPVSQFTEDLRSCCLQPQCLGCLVSHHTSHQIQGFSLCWDPNSQKALAAEDEHPLLTHHPVCTGAGNEGKLLSGSYL